MGRLIDTNDLHNKVMLNKSDWGIFATQIDNLIESIVMQTPTAEAIPKDQYETRLKADMVAILRLFEQHDDTDLIEVKYVRLTIQQKINSLKADQEGEE